MLLLIIQVYALLPSLCLWDEEMAGKSFDILDQVVLPCVILFEK